MKRTFFLNSLFFLLLTPSCYSQINLYVSGAGNDLNNGTSISTPFKTLKRAHDALPSTFSANYNIILLNNGEIPIADNNASSFIWTKSGTPQYSITVSSASTTRSIVTRVNDNEPYIIKLLNVDYVNFKMIHFKNVSAGAFMIDNADYCNIDYCKFSGVNYIFAANAGNATIWIGVQNGTAGSKSTGNTISNNLISDIFIYNNPAGDKTRIQAIYLSEYSEFNTIYNNTIYDATSYAIHFWHANFNNNIATRNIITQNIQEGVGSPAFALGCESNEPISTITNNRIVNNYVFDGNNTYCTTLSSPLNSNNDPHNTAEDETVNYKYPNIITGFYYPNDPYWLGYNPSRINNKVVSGDFNGDGFWDEIAALYDNGNGTTNIHLWKSDITSKKALFYQNGSQGWWYGGSYSASQTSGRVVSGRMDITGGSDIAAFYDYGNNNTQIHVWKSDPANNSFEAPQVWWNTSGYDANRITNRVVNGNFNADNLTDIAAFYNNGDGTTNLHVWTSTGSSYTYHWSNGWWGESSGQYQVSKITGKVVSGDFNGDGLSDIAAFYDEGVGLTKLQVWLTNGSSFTYQGNAGWWSNVPSNFDASKITGRIVSNDFDGNGKSDIAAFYDNGLGGSSLRVWLSTGPSFTYQGDAGWWSASTGYDVSNLTGRVISGNFDRTSNNDIMGFFDYGYAGGSLRTHVWQKNIGNSFSYVNESLGYPWFTTFIFDKNLDINIPGEESYPENAPEHFSVYPNPSNTFFLINGLNSTYETTVEIFDFTGKVISRSIGNDEQLKLSAESLPIGSFIIKILNGEKIEFKKIIRN